jgi:hypothetical protein
MARLQIKNDIQSLSRLPVLALVSSILLTSCGGGSGDENLDPIVRVVAFNESSVAPLQSKNSWYVINENPPFGPRDHASVIKINNKIHLRGGWYRGPSLYQDYWTSDDSGLNWTHIHGDTRPIFNDLIDPILYEDTSIPDPYARFGYFNSLLWLIDDKIHYSNDGTSWGVYPAILGNPGSAADLVLLNGSNKLIAVDSGNNSSWSISASLTRSENFQIHENFRKRGGAAIYQNNGYFYVAGGVSGNYADFNNEIWQSKDGEVWRKLVYPNGEGVKAPWENIQWPCVTADSSGRVWVVGGYDFVKKINISKVWFSDDGISWREYLDNVPEGAVSALIPRHASVCVYDEANSRIINIAGKGGVDPENDYAFVTKSIIAIPIPPP